MFRSGVQADLPLALIPIKETEARLPSVTVYMRFARYQGRAINATWPPV